MADVSLTERARAALAAIPTARHSALTGGPVFADDEALFRNLGLRSKWGVWTELGCEATRLLTEKASIGAKSTIQIRIVRVRDEIYMRRADVCDLLEEFAGSEETDVRNRMREMISNMRGGQS